MEKEIAKLENENLVIFTDRLTQIYNIENTKDSKKGKGQFFTPINLAKYMASLSEINKEEVSILDPGAGMGILSVSLIEQIVAKKKVKKVSLVCYETDKQVLPYLDNVLKEIKVVLDKKSILFVYTILEKDFVLSNADILTSNLINFKNKEKNLFDVIISNPPYFKLNKTDLQIAKFKDIISGQPNIYFLFMAISARLLNSEGEMIFITPRSFCSGLYYSKFRKWLMNNVNFANIHIFNSRKELFSRESVLQENIITRFTKQEQKNITISKSTNGYFLDNTGIEVLKKDVINKSNGHIFFRIPSNEHELNIIRQLDQLPFNFYKLGIKISTGKVVAFRNKESLSNNISSDSVPLLWMHNIKNGKIEWPLKNKDKPISIKNNVTTKKLLLEFGNYLIIKRFSVKEQKRRFDMAIINEDEFKEFKYFALDNMINYIYNPYQKLNKNQISGIAKYLNLPIVDLYFRILNGHTQINANEVYALPFPSLDQLESFGKNSSEIINLLNKRISDINNESHEKHILELILA